MASAALAAAAAGGGVASAAARQPELGRRPWLRGGERAPSSAAAAASAPHRAPAVGVSGSEHAAFLKGVAKVPPPALLPALLRVLEARGEELVPPGDRRGILPLVVPLSRDPATGSTKALLRWPTAPTSMELPIVLVNDTGVLLMAKTVEEYIRRLLAEEDAEGSRSTVSAAAGDDGANLYKSGSFSASGISKLEVFLMKKVGMFPDVLEALALGHLERGDEVSALVTGEYYASRQHFPGFGRPFIFNAQLMLRVGREAEARDAARIALKSPWWTLGAPFQEVADLSGYGSTQLEFVREKLSEEGRREDITKGKAPAQVALDQAAFLLDLAAAQGSWDASRERLASLYVEGGYSDIAKFILADT